MTRDDTDDKPLLTVEEAARRLGIGRTTMYGLVSSGDVESITLDRRLRRVPAECLDEYIATQRRKQTQAKQTAMGAA